MRNWKRTMACVVASVMIAGAAAEAVTPVVSATEQVQDLSEKLSDSGGTENPHDPEIHLTSKDGGGLIEGKTVSEREGDLDADPVEVTVDPMENDPKTDDSSEDTSEDLKESTEPVENTENTEEDLPGEPTKTSEAGDDIMLTSDTESDTNLENDQLMADSEDDSPIVIEEFRLLDPIELETVVPFPRSSMLRKTRSIAAGSGRVTLKSSKEAKYIDRLEITDNVSYVKDLYDILVESTDNDGTNDWLIDNTDLPTVKYGESDISVIEVGQVGIERNAGAESAFKASNPEKDWFEYYYSDIDNILSDVYYNVGVAYQAFDRDHPEVFWLYDLLQTGATTLAYNDHIEVKIFIAVNIKTFKSTPVNYRERSNIKSDIKRREGYVNTILSGASGSDYEKIKYFNKWLTEHNEYNLLVATNKDPKNGMPYECITALEGKIGDDGPVCEGYARAFKVLCDKEGIPCELITGFTSEKNESTGKFTSGAHMWNMVRLDGEWYIVDVTWNDPYYASGSADTAISGRENESCLCIGMDTIFGSDGKTMENSRTVYNCSVKDNIEFSNQPVVSKKAYEPGPENPDNELKEIQVLDSKIVVGTASYDLSWSGLAPEYDGQSHSPVLTGVPSFLTVSYSGDKDKKDISGTAYKIKAEFALSDASASAQYTFKDSKNYVEKEWNITKRAITIKGGEIEIFDGEEIGTLLCSITSGSLISGDVISGAPAAASHSYDPTKPTPTANLPLKIVVEQGAVGIKRGSSDVSGNYDITWVDGQITIKEAVSKATSISISGPDTIAVPKASPNSVTTDSIALTATVKDQYGNVMTNHPVVRWQVDNSKQDEATITGGILTIRNSTSAGEITVYATVDGVSSPAEHTITVTRESRAADSVVITKNNAHITAYTMTIPTNDTDQTERFSVLVYDQYGIPKTDDAISWSIEGTQAGVSVQNNASAGTAGIVTVTKDASEGNVTLKAAAGGKNASVIIMLTATPVENETKTDFVSKIYGDASFEAWTKPSEGTVSVAYESSDTAVATVSSDGIVTILKPGKTTISIVGTVKTSEKIINISSTLGMEVKRKSLTVKPKDITVTKGDIMPASFAWEYDGLLIGDESKITIYPADNTEFDIYVSSGGGRGDVVTDTQTPGTYVLESKGYQMESEYYDIVPAPGRFIVKPSGSSTSPGGMYQPTFPKDDEIPDSTDDRVLDLGDTVVTVGGDSIDGGVDVRLDVDDVADLDDREVPGDLGNTEYDTFQKVVWKLSSVISGVVGSTVGKTATYDVKLVYKINNTWVKATEKNFPTEGIDVMLPYPEGTGKDTHDFTVAHMFTVTSPRLGIKAGDVETPQCTKTDAGLRVRVKGLSPISIHARPIEKKSSDKKKSGSSSSRSGSGSGGSSYVAPMVYTRSIYRLYNMFNGDHMLTASQVERDLLLTSGWVNEGIAMTVNLPTAVNPVYRLLDPRTGRHFFTTNFVERDQKVLAGWISEGVAFNISGAQMASVYSLSGPGQTGMYLFTTSLAERNSLLAAGWAVR